MNTFQAGFFNLALALGLGLGALGLGLGALGLTLGICQIVNSILRQKTRLLDVKCALVYDHKQSEAAEYNINEEQPDKSRGLNCGL